ncbi:MAG: ABC transporter ATP-binding protein [Chloroflexi bacterium]|nr:ABC transporter ATP-binding protein [Chloroflexota bacterium]
MRYGSRYALDGVDLRIDRGEVVVILGPNGAGKTTLIEILEGIRHPSAGTAQVLGQDPWHADDAWRARVGVVLQSWRDHAKWRVRDLLHHLGSFYAPWSSTERRRPVDTDELLGLVGLAAAADQRVATLSGGMRRRLDVAIGLVGRPELLFLDEPTAGFDPEARRDFHEMIHGLTDLEGMTVLLTTHDLAEAERLADRIVILASGRVRAEGSPDALSRQASASSEVRWTIDGQRQVHATIDAVPFVQQLLAAHGDALTDLEVRRASLEDAYLTLVRDQEATQPGEVPAA